MLNNLNFFRNSWLYFLKFSKRVTKEITNLYKTDWILIPVHVKSAIRVTRSRFFFFFGPKEGLDIQLPHSRPSLRQYLTMKNNNTITTCTLANCPIRDPNMSKTYIIYCLICLKCHNFYIGSIIRSLHIRIKEHLNTCASLFHKHFIKFKNNDNNFSIKIEAIVHNST